MSASSWWPVFLTGLGLSASLIVAIGAQNAFVLRQGLRREHVLVVVLACSLLDIGLMAAGIGGLGRLVGERPLLLNGLAAAGALALAFYGWAALRRALHPAQLLASAGAAPATWRAVLGQTLSISLLNPHVYLDTVVLVGAVGARQPSGLQGAFLAGAGLASALWFATLGWGARQLAPWFARPLAWRLLDAGVALTMWAIALSLALAVWRGALGAG